MLMNDLNTTDRTEKTVSPLKHDYKGRFSRKGQLDTEKKMEHGRCRQYSDCIVFNFFVIDGFYLVCRLGKR